jgi:hypothetical protein
MNPARRSRNQKQVIFLEEFCSGLRVIPEIPPSPPFSKGGLGGISEKRFPPKYSLQKLESLHVSSTARLRRNQKCLECLKLKDSGSYLKLCPGLLTKFKEFERK